MKVAEAIRFLESRGFTIVGREVNYCVRCGAKLFHPVMLNGAPFGRVCARKELLGEETP